MPLTIPPYEGQGWTDNSTPDLSAETLNAVDDGIAAATNGVNAIAEAVVNQIINDPEKIASIAVAYALQQQINTTNSNLVATNTGLTNTTNALNGRVPPRIAFRWDDGGALQLYVDGAYFGSIKFIDK